MEHGICQESASNNSTDTSKLINAAKEIMTEAGTCALITMDKDGSPRARTMDPFLPEENFTVWFGTNANSRKVDQIKNDSRVTLYYFDDKTQGYVVIEGTAQLIVDSTEKENHWKQEWESFYPNKSENYMLIKVIPISLEILSPSHGIFNDPITWQPPVISFEMH
jgi:general stress protein 26